MLLVHVVHCSPEIVGDADSICSWHYCAGHISASSVGV